MDVDGVLGDVVAPVVSLTVGDAAFYCLRPRARYEKQRG